MSKLSNGAKQSIIEEFLSGNGVSTSLNHFAIKQKLLLKANVLMFNELQILKGADLVEPNSHLSSPHLEPSVPN